MAQQHTLPTMSLQIAQELEVQEHQVKAAIELLDDGASVPFIARYRKEVTHGLTDTHLRQLEERLEYLRDLQNQKETALKTIQELGKLTPSLEHELLHAGTKQLLADLYQPYRPKRKSKALEAIEAGLEPLAQSIWSDPTQDPEVLAQTFVKADSKIDSSKSALEGARHILAEQWSEIPTLVQNLRLFFREEAHLISKRKKQPVKTEESQRKEKLTDNQIAQLKKQEQIEKKAVKFTDYFDRHEAVKTIASHRTLALFRGRKEGILDLEINIPDLAVEQLHPCIGRIYQQLDYQPQDRAADAWLTAALQWCWRVKLHSKLENDLLAEIKEKADLDSIGVFARNLKNLLMSAPAGARATIGLDPGLRTGVKLAVVDNTGQVIDHGAIYPHAPKNQWDESLSTLKQLCEKYNVELIAIGNGTASRETDKLAAQLVRQYPELHLKKATVSEAGASIYSASEYASKELPSLDVSIRGAVSIARRLQDPLAELVKIEPKSIGVGQYQHDVSQPKLAKSLETVVEDCVNAVGVDVNTASAKLLARVAGLNDTIAQNIINFRDEHGVFKNREVLKKVPRLGNRTFEQAAGFLRIRNGENPLDASAVHPESYAIVERMAKAIQKPLSALVGSSEPLNLNPTDYASNDVGEVTIQDIIDELEKPGRDPRPEFKTIEFRDDVLEIKDLKQDMILDGIVTNVTNFGAFVDVGVHQDGLVHISALTNSFVSDPHSVVKTGDLVKVKVLNADVNRKRIDLTMRLEEVSASRKGDAIPSTPARPTQPKVAQSRPQSRPQSKNKQQPKAVPEKKEKALPAGKTGTFADLFASLKK